MLAKRVIPCLDVKNGRVVKGVQFQALRDCGDPAMLGQHYSAEGRTSSCFWILRRRRRADGRCSNG